MTLPSLRLALVGAAAATAVLVPAGAASAASLTISDATHDTYRDDTSGSTETYVPAGSRINTDLRRTVVRHGAHRVVVKATYVDLRRTGDPLFFMFEVRTNEGLKRQVGVETMSSPKGTTMFSKPSGSDAKCSGLSHAVDYAANTVTVSVPRACLSRPRWVQLLVGAVSMSSNGDTYIDNGHNATSDEPKTWSARVRKG